MDQKEQFYELLEKHTASLDKKKKEKFIISQDVYKKIMECLQLAKGIPCPDGAGFKFWCNKHFKVETIGSSQVIYCKKTSSPVTTKEDMFDTIKQCHQRVGHSRRDKTWDEAHKNYAWIRREAVEFFLQTCPDCSVDCSVQSI